MLQPFPSFLDVSRSFAGRMRDETDAMCRHKFPQSGSILGRGGEANTVSTRPPQVTPLGEGSWLWPGGLTAATWDHVNDPQHGQ
jgi:hypothetical protein